MSKYGRGWVEKKVEKNHLFSPYTSIFKGFSELFGAAQKAKKVEKPKKETKTDIFKLKMARNIAETETKAATWTIYHHFKKHHNMLNW